MDGWMDGSELGHSTLQEAVAVSTPSNGLVRLVERRVGCQGAAYQEGYDRRYNGCKESLGIYTGTSMRARRGTVGEKYGEKATVSRLPHLARNMRQGSPHSIIDIKNCEMHVHLQ
jgi:hypothetical protein